MAEHFDILAGRIFVGEAKTVRFGPIRDKQTGAPIDPDGYNVRFRVKRGPREQEALLEVQGTVGPGGTFARVVAAPEFFIDMTLDDTDTELVPPGEWAYGFARVDGDETVLSYGGITFSDSAVLP